ncbi:hypothetical protein BC939DRAFT_441773 [Gamsiella multidivaricata]|uniref:uncharacterized protein n=1 Tax=Gamsiella multidivaricata TaxID=101098 RepID=UPI00221EC9BC|nr:uncharacterized protein BC939DRAFT_441773 [Gamsiella multidivaricata]KAI7829398.1 hypothetical protein BC939DRAFT_441773 [Gamsiella multidivaricata]
MIAVRAKRGSAPSIFLCLCLSRPTVAIGQHIPQVHRGVWMSVRYFRKVRAEQGHRWSRTISRSQTAPVFATVGYG